MSHFAISAVGRDRPGIVAAIAAGLLELGCNIEDSRMTILRGHFAVMLIVALPEGAEHAELERRMTEVRDELGLEVLTVSEIAELDPGTEPASHVISVYGGDHPGIVHAVSSALADRGVSITDLQTKLTGSEERPIYVMMLEVALGGADPEEIEELLAGVGAEAAVEVSMHPLEAEPL